MEKEKNNKKRIIIIGIAIVVIILIISVVVNSMNATKSKKGNKSKKVYKLKYDLNTPMNITTPSSGGISSETEAILLMTAKEVGEVQVASFKVKNNTKKAMTISPSDFKIAFRYPADPDTEDSYHLIEEEKSNEYYEIEVTKPTEKIKLEAGQKTDVEVKATLKKSLENKYIIASYYIYLNER